MERPRLPCYVGLHSCSGWDLGVEIEISEFRFCVGVGRLNLQSALVYLMFCLVVSGVCLFGGAFLVVFDGGVVIYSIFA